MGLFGLASQLAPVGFAYAAKDEAGGLGCRRWLRRGCRRGVGRQGALAFKLGHGDDRQFQVFPRVLDTQCAVGVAAVTTVFIAVMNPFLLGHLAPILSVPYPRLEHAIEARRDILARREHVPEARRCLCPACALACQAEHQGAD